MENLKNDKTNMEELKNRQEDAMSFNSLKCDDGRKFLRSFPSCCLSISKSQPHRDKNKPTFFQQIYITGYSVKYGR